MRGGLRNFFVTGALGALTAALLLGCGVGSSTKSKSKSREMISVPVGVSLQGDAFNLALPTTDDFVIQITGCDSGFTATVTSTAGAPVGAINLYKGDQNCVAGLESFGWNALTYSKSGGGGTLTTGSALFDDGAGSEMKATVYIELDAVLSALSKAQFVVAEILPGADHEVPVVNYADSIPNVVEGIEAPNMSVYSATLTGVEAGTGYGTFSIAFECGSAIVVNDCPSALANAQPMTAMRVAVVADTYGGDLTYTEAETIMTGGNVVSVVGGMVGAVNLNGGMTVTGLTGNAQLHTAGRNMIVVIEYTETTRNNAVSFRYFNMDLEDPMN